MIIYKATNIVNGKVYIGKSKKSLNERRKVHERTVIRGNYGYVSKFYRAMKKYGFKKFIWTIVKDNIQDEKTLSEKEKHYIQKFDSIKNGYNISVGGEGGDNFTNHPLKEEIRSKISRSNKGKKRSEEFKKHNRERQIGRVFSPETIRKRSRALKGRKLTTEWKEKIRQSLLGRTLPESVKKKISESQTGKIFSEEHKRKIGNGRRGKRHTKETKLMISAKLKGRIITPEWRKNMQAGQKNRWKKTKKLKN